MPKAGVITIDVNASTAKFAVDMEKINGQVRQFGSSGGASMAPMNVALRELGGNFENNTRGAARFLATTLGLGPAVAAAFPVIGGLAFAGMLVDLGKKVFDFFKQMEDAPAKIRNAFREINAPLQQSNDEIQVANDKLANRLAVTDNRRPNTLKLMLDEGVLAANKLSAALDKDLGKINDLMTNAQTGVVGRVWDALTSRWMLGGSGDDEFTGDAKLDSLSKSIGGETGVGGFRGEITKLASRFDQLIIDAAKNGDLKAQDSAQDHKTSALVDLLTGKRDVLEDSLQGRNSRAKETDPRVIEALTAYSGQLTGTIASLSVQHSSYVLNQRNDQAEAAKEEREKEWREPYGNETKKLEAEIAKARLEYVRSTGLPQRTQSGLEAEAVSQPEIERINRDLKHQGKPELTSEQTGHITDLNAQIQELHDQTAWDKQVIAEATALANKEASETVLANAAGQGYQALRQAYIESQTTALLKEHNLDPEWQKSHQKDIAIAGAGFGDAFDVSQQNQSTIATQSLQQQIILQLELTTAQTKGAEAVRLVAQAWKERQMAGKGELGSQIVAERELFDAERDNKSAANIAAINQKVTATRNLTAAIVDGAEAQRKAALAAKYSEMAFQGHTSDEIAAQSKLDELEHQKQITEEALKSVNAYRDQLYVISEQLSVLEALKDKVKDRVALQIQERELQRQMLQLDRQRDEQLGTAGAGMRNFFRDMQLEAQKVGDILRTGLEGAVTGVSDEIGKLVTGQKTSFGKMFQQQGEHMVSNSVHAALSYGLGKLGAHFGIKAKADGSEANPYYVIVKDKASSPSDDQPGQFNLGAIRNAIKAIGGGIRNLLGAGAGAAGAAAPGAAGSIESVSSVFTPIAALAEGADSVDPGHSYVVGDGGEPEVFVPHVAGSVTPAHKMAGDTYHYSIDARGADLGASNRVSRAIEASHNSAAAAGVRGSVERSRRVPQRG